MADSAGRSAETLAHALRLWASTEADPVTAAVDLLILEVWHRRASFVRACVHDDEGVLWIRWHEARDFLAGNPRGSTTELAMLDLAVTLAEDRFRLGNMGRVHRQWIADAAAAAVGLGPDEKPAPLLSESQRFQVGLAREKADRWMQDNGPDIYGTDRAMVDAIRDLLAIIDQFAPGGADVG